MFDKPKKMPVPKGAKESWVVRYPGGRKPFDREKTAMDFARSARAEEKGWAEVSHLVERVVSPR
jgi:hypothetical protein